MIILGLNAFHADSAACIVRDGKLVAAAEEERFRRVKHWAGFPSQAIAYCLREGGLSLDDVDHVAINQNNAAQLPRKLAYLVSARPNPRLVIERIRNRRARQQLPDRLAALFPGARLRANLHQVEHHAAHLSSAFHVSPFAEAVVVSLDGFGDFASAAWGVGSGTEIKLDGRILFPHSLGIFYEAMTRYLGFPEYGDEYKVMGLGAIRKPGSFRHTSPARTPEARRIVRARSALFPPSYRRILISVGRHGAADQRSFFTGIGRTGGAAPASGGAARRTPSRHREGRAGDIRRSLFQPDPSICRNDTN